MILDKDEQTKKFLIQEYYNKDKSITRIAKENNKTYSAIRNLLCYFNIDRKSNGRKTVILDRDSLEQDLRENQISIVAQKYNCSINIIRYWAKKYDIKYIVRNGFNDVNHYFFDQWSHEMAYILGFITADGNVSGYKPYLSIELKRSDEIILEFILKKIYPSGKIYRYEHYDKRSGKTYHSSKIMIYSQYIKDRLIDYSIFPNKTGKHELNFEIPEIYKWDFIRGFLDGDGCIHVKSGRINISFACQSIKFLEQLQSLIGIIGTIDYASKPPILKYFCRNSLCIRDKLYENDCFSLERKKKIAFDTNDQNLPYIWSEQEDKLAYRIVISGGRGNALRAELPHLTKEEAHSKVSRILKRIKNEKI